MKNYLLKFSLIVLCFSCGESEEEMKINEEKQEQEIEETSNDLFESLEDDLKEEEE